MAAEKIPQWKIDHPTWRFDHVAAGKKAMATSQRLYSRADESFSQMIGRTGGTRLRGGGKPFDHDRAVYWGSVGGKTPRKGKKQN